MLTDAAHYMTSEKEDFYNTINAPRAKIAPALYVKLEHGHATSISVERSFSMFGKLLAKDRNFLPENVSKYMTMYYNSKN